MVENLVLFNQTKKLKKKKKSPSTYPIFFLVIIPEHNYFLFWPDGLILLYIVAIINIAEQSTAIIIAGNCSVGIRLKPFIHFANLLMAHCNNQLIPFGR